MDQDGILAISVTALAIALVWYWYRSTRQVRRCCSLLRPVATRLRTAPPVALTCTHSLTRSLALWSQRLVQHPLADRVVLITGCDTGLGRATALHLRRRGARVWAGCLTTEGARAIEEEARTQVHHHANGYLRSIQLDVTSDASVTAGLALLTSAEPAGLHALVNNAGTMAGSNLVEFTSLDAYERTMQVNWLGVVRVCQAALPALKRRAQFGGSDAGVRIINISSFLGRVGDACTREQRRQEHG